MISITINYKILDDDAIELDMIPLVYVFHKNVKKLTIQKSHQSSQVDLSNLTRNLIQSEDFDSGSDEMCELAKIHSNYLGDEFCETMTELEYNLILCFISDEPDILHLRSILNDSTYNGYTLSFDFDDKQVEISNFVNLLQQVQEL